jgi:hypothetical protein
MILNVYGFTGNVSISLEYGYTDAQGNPVIMANHTVTFQNGTMIVDNYQAYNVIDLNYHSK